MSWYGPKISKILGILLIFGFNLRREHFVMYTFLEMNRNQLTVVGGSEHSEGVEFQQQEALTGAAE